MAMVAMAKPFVEKFDDNFQSLQEAGAEKERSEIQNLAIEIIQKWVLPFADSFIARFDMPKKEVSDSGEQPKAEKKSAKAKELKLRLIPHDITSLMMKPQHIAQADAVITSTTITIIQHSTMTMTTTITITVQSLPSSPSPSPS